MITSNLSSSQKKTSFDSRAGSEKPNNLHEFDIMSGWETSDKEALQLNDR